MSWYTSLCSGLRIKASGWCKYMRKPSLDSRFFPLADKDEAEQQLTGGQACICGQCGSHSNTVSLKRTWFPEFYFKWESEQILIENWHMNQRNDFVTLCRLDETCPQYLCTQKYYISKREPSSQNEGISIGFAWILSLSCTFILAGTICYPIGLSNWLAGFTNWYWTC